MMQQQGSQSLPVSEPGLQEHRPGIRRRLSSLSVNLKIQPSPPADAAWAFRRSKSLSSMGENADDSIRKWWGWGWGWILSRKPAFVADLEMNEEETRNKGSWRGVFFKVTSQLRRKLSRPDDVGLPKTMRYS